jgi:hypothetical protein
LSAGAPHARLVALLGIALLAASAIAGVVTRPQDVPSQIESRTIVAAPNLSMADALGIGGLSTMHLDAADVPSPAGRTDVVAYYGSPRVPAMGILGQHEPHALADMLALRTRTFDDLNGDIATLPALHLVYAIAQPEPGDGTYLRYVDDRTVRAFLDLARRRGFVLVLDLQIGHSDALTETLKAQRWLSEPDVFLALDPEFALAGRDAPGDAIGSLAASDINAVQWYLAELSRAKQLPQKMLIVHQFEGFMLPDAHAIERRAGVDVVIDMDGYGPAEIKQAKYERYVTVPPVFGGIKVFLQHDPDPLTEAALLALRPRPAFFLYQ